MNAKAGSAQLLKETDIKIAILLSPSLSHSWLYVVIYIFPQFPVLKSFCFYILSSECFFSLILPCSNAFAIRNRFFNKINNTNYIKNFKYLSAHFLPFWEKTFLGSIFCVTSLSKIRLSIPVCSEKKVSNFRPRVERTPEG